MSNGFICERFARVFKRKSGQVKAFRSQNGADTFCDGLTITESLKAKGENVLVTPKQHCHIHGSWWCPRVFVDRLTRESMSFTLADFR